MWAPFVLDTKDVDVLHEYEQQRCSRKETLSWTSILIRSRISHAKSITPLGDYPEQRKASDGWNG